MLQTRKTFRELNVNTVVIILTLEEIYILKVLQCHESNLEKFIYESGRSNFTH